MLDVFWKHQANSASSVPVLTIYHSHIEGLTLRVVEHFDVVGHLPGKLHRVKLEPDVPVLSPED